MKNYFMKCLVLTGQYVPPFHTPVAFHSYKYIHIFDCSKK